MNHWHDDDEPEWDEELLDDDQFDDVLPCPHCGADVHEDAPQCPSCGMYITHSTSPWKGRPWWWVLLGALGVIAALWLMLGL